MTNKTEIVSVSADAIYAIADRVKFNCPNAAKELEELIAAAPAEDVRAVGEEPVRLTAVATLRDDGDGALQADWLLEGGTSELFEGMILLVADNDPTLCEEDGSAEVYRHPQRPVVLPERKTQRNAAPYGTYDYGWNACIDEFERLNK